MESLLDDADLSVELSREKFESLNDELFTRCINTVTTVLKDASLAINDVTDVVLVGGSTRVPALQDRLKALFGGRIELCRSINPDEVRRSLASCVVPVLFCSPRDVWCSGHAPLCLALVAKAALD